MSMHDGREPWQQSGGAGAWPPHDPYAPTHHQPAAGGGYVPPTQWGGAPPAGDQWSSGQPQYWPPQQPAAPPPPPKSNGRIIAIVVVAGVVVLGLIAIIIAQIAGRGGSGTGPTVSSTVAAPPTTVAPATFVLTGTETLYDATGTNIRSTGSGCEGTGGYRDITEGTQVIIRDASGQVVATGDLDPGTGTTTKCTFNFSVKGLPLSSSSFTIEIGDNRGKFTLTREKAQQGINLRLGTPDN